MRGFFHLFFFWSLSVRVSPARWRWCYIPSVPYVFSQRGDESLGARPQQQPRHSGLGCVTRAIAGPTLTAVLFIWNWFTVLDWMSPQWRPKVLRSRWRELEQRRWRSEMLCVECDACPQLLGWWMGAMPLVSTVTLCTQLVCRQCWPEKKTWLGKCQCHLS